MKPYEVFASRFGGRIAVSPQFILEKAHRYYLLNPHLKKIVKGNFYYSGLYLGKLKHGIFFPSFNLLNLLLVVSANKIIIDSKAAWLFTCGRDVFGKSVLKRMGSMQKGDSTLILNEYCECLGFGKIIGGFDLSEDKVVIKNVLDVGDFLRRETR